MKLTDYLFPLNGIFAVVLLTGTQTARADSTIKYRCHYDESAKMEIVSWIDVELTAQHFAEGPPLIRQMKMVVVKPEGGGLGQENKEFSGYPIREQFFVDGKLTTKRYLLGHNSLSVAVPGVSMGALGYAIWENAPAKSAKCVLR